MRSIFLIASICISFVSFSQKKYGVIKASALKPLIKIYSAAFEYGVEKISFQLSGEGGEYYRGTSSPGNTYKVTGWALTPESRYYPLRYDNSKFQPFFGVALQYGKLNEDYIFLPGSPVSRHKGTLRNYKIYAGNGFALKRFWVEFLVALNFNKTTVDYPFGIPTIGFTDYFLADQNKHLKFELSIGYFIFKKQVQLRQ